MSREGVTKGQTPVAVGTDDDDKRSDPTQPALDQVRAYFSRDHFAAAAGCVIDDATPGHAVVRMPLRDDLHRNAQGSVMGGAIFTLADFALAVASNVGQAPTVSVSNQIEFLSAARGTRLVATCEADRSGRALGFYTTDVYDELGTHVARMTATCFRRQRP